MKFLYLIPFIMMISSCNPTTKTEMSTTKAGEVSTSGIVAEPDCDEKAKQKVEIKEDEIKLGGTDTGCTLE